MMVLLGIRVDRAYAANINATVTKAETIGSQVNEHGDIIGSMDQAKVTDNTSVSTEDNTADSTSVVKQEDTEEANTTKEVTADEALTEDALTEQEISEGQEISEEQETSEEKDYLQEFTGKIILGEKKVTIQQGETYSLKATLSEDNFTDEKMNYQSSNKKIITVSQKGIIKALHWGNATVTITLGEAKTVCKVTVTKDVEITISAAGDCTLSSDIKQPASVNFFSVYNKQKKDAYFFKNVKPIFEKDDMTIVNFEGTLSSRGSRVEKQWAFRGKPSYTNILSEGSVEAVAFANNHVKDYGQISYTDTISSFEKANIAYSSYSKIGIYEVKGIKIGMISIQETSVERANYLAVLRKAIKTMNKKNPDLLIVSFHWGIERTRNVTKSQTELSRIAIEEGGADLVLGHHPHVLQPIEKYKGAYIVYSLGNFCFGGNTNPPDKDTMIYQQTFTFHNDKLVQDENVRIIPCSVSSVSIRNNYQPTPSMGSEKKRILKRMNDYCKQYGISFDKNGRVIPKAEIKRRVNK